MSWLSTVNNLFSSASSSSFFTSFSRSTSSLPTMAANTGSGSGAAEREGLMRRPSHLEVPSPNGMMDSATSSAMSSSTSLAPDSTTGYFPVASRSSMSSEVSDENDYTTQQRPGMHRGETTPAGTSLSQKTPKKLDALQRQFPKPEHEPTVEEMLARPPQKWSVGHYVKNAREVKAPVVDKEQEAKAFAEAKKELLRAKQELQNLAIPAVPRR
ncbi:hypothetical protein QBC46DRAFT_157616 [Diplogelasinospora grovesii]|uniref:Uncharacterized protein n=1 Tax=Diplogelasinospora grovesii TaxID=303347 RepID=A0AAN6NGY4_9PEZI|nr:hypothetical protein QBC46DRAFT_157616 [Diplogelasinospora grovesii]